MLGGGVGGDVRRADEPGQRGDVDHAAPAALEHRGQHGAREQVGPGRVDVQVALPECRVGLGERRRLGDPRVVDEDVDPAQARHDRRDSSRDRALVGHVEHERHRRHPEAGDRRRRRFHLIGRPRGDRDGAAFPGQRQRDLTADAASGAGDERDRLTGRIRHGLSAQNRKKSGRLVDALSRPESVRQRTRGGLLLEGRLGLDDGLDDEDAQPASARNSNSSTSERGRRFMRPFYRGIRYI